MNEQQYKQFQERMNAMMMVIKINNPEKYEELVRLVGMWAPEMRAYNYSKWVQANYEVDPDNLVSLSVYSLLMNMPIDALKQKIMMEYDYKTR